MNGLTRRIMPACMALGLLAGTVLPSPAFAQPVAHTDVAINQDWPVNRQLLLAGAGAIVGALAFNIFAAPFGTVPFAGGALEAVPQSVAVGSRFLGIAAGGVGAAAGTWVYDRWTGQHSDYAYIASLVVGGLAGVAVGNYLTVGVLGNPPYYVGAGLANSADVMTSSAAQAVSRVYVVTMGVFGAWVADWVYRR